MKHWPEFDGNGDLPSGIHRATISEVLQHFGSRNLQRRIVAQRLERVYNLARGTGQLARFVIFGSFVTAKPDPNDVDVFMLMEDAFDLNRETGEAAIIFDHMAAQSAEGGKRFLDKTGSRNRWRTGCA